MATILYTWELGGGFGHILPFRPLAQEFTYRGHRVVAALRDLTHAEQAFGDLGIPYLPAPHKTWKTEDRITPLLTFAHILNNVGFSRVEDLRTLTIAWQALFDAVRPDLVICDHSPAALVALPGCGLPYVTFGSGFFLPVDESPLPNLATWVPADLQQLRRDEKHVLQVINSVLAARSQPPISRVTQLYADAADRLLITFPELDTYRNRGEVSYLGCWSHSRGEPFQWPNGTGPKVFAYLKDFPAIKELISFLRNRSWPTVVVAPGLAAQLRQFAGPTLTVTESPLDLRQVAGECGVAIHHATHSILAELLLYGTPTLVLPFTMEQILLSRRLVALEGGIAANAANPNEILQGLQQLLGSKQHAAAARQFAQRHASYSPQDAIQSAVKRVEDLLPR